MSRDRGRCDSFDIGTASVDDAISTLYGEVPASADGVSHVAAVWAAPDGSLPVLEIDTAAPRSEIDTFVLDYSRARTDAIIITGEILRREPHLHYELASAKAGALRSWRRERLARREPPYVVVLTRGEQLPIDHPIFSTTRPEDSTPAPARPVVFTSTRAASLLETPLRRRGVEVANVASPDVHACIDFVRNELHARAISIECGPHTSRQLHTDRTVDELLLSIYRGPSRPSIVAGRGFIDAHELCTAYEEPVAACMLQQASGPWSFHRFVRGSAMPVIAQHG